MEAIYYSPKIKDIILISVTSYSVAIVTKNCSYRYNIKRGIQFLIENNYELIGYVNE
jgi:hypothetical protein